MHWCALLRIGAVLLLVAVFLLGLAAVPLTGGKLSALGELRLRGRSVLFASLGVAVAVTTLFPRGSHAAHVWLNMATYLGALVALWLNRRLRGVFVIAAGTVANVTATAVNGGIMPASSSALTVAGLAPVSQGFVNSTTVVHPRLPWLGDVFGAPRWIPFHNVFSVGDVLIVFGAIVLVLSLCGSRLVPAARLRREEPEVGIEPTT